MTKLIQRVLRTSTAQAATSAQQAYCTPGCKMYYYSPGCWRRVCTGTDCRTTSAIICQY